VQIKYEAKLKDDSYQFSQQRQENDQKRQVLKHEALENIERKLKLQKQAMLFQQEEKLRQVRIEVEKRGLDARKAVQLKVEHEHLQKENELHLNFHKESSNKKF
jgi:hypothetical protein